MLHGLNVFRSYDTFGRKLNTSTVLSILRTLIGTTGWFISGSFANSKVSSPKDIDIFFRSKDDYEKAKSAMVSRDGLFTGIHLVTDNAITYHVDQIGDVQFIHKYFGTPQEIFEQFDLNVCKKAIMPDGTCVQDHTSDDKLQICNIKGDTFARYFKYAQRFYSHIEVTRLGKQLVDDYILDDTLVEYYYDNSNLTAPTNHLLLKAAKEYIYTRDYALEQARLKAPELLL